MNLAWKDIKRQRLRFVLTGLGLGLLFTVVLAMTGIYRGMVEEATVLVDRLEADLWIVQRDTQGPFAERSYIPSNVTPRATLVRGVRAARSFVSYTVQREHAGKPLRMTIVGLDWPRDRGAWLPMVAGRTLEQGHWELIADKTLGFTLGERVPMGSEAYTVVGIVKGMVSSSGDGLALFTVPDVQRIVEDVPGEAVRLDRQARAGRIRRGLPRLPNLAASAAEGQELPGLGPPPLNATLVSVNPGVPVGRVQDAILRWGDVSVHTSEDQRTLLLSGVIDKSRKQIKLFRGLLAIVSSIVVTLVLYNMTTAKSREIALLKLMGAKLSMVVSMIMQQALALGLIAYSVALFLANVAFPHFPRRVIVTSTEFVGLGVLAFVICMLASIAGIRHASKIPTTTILSG